jgi:LPS export ABC transporter protein LptC
MATGTWYLSSALTGREIVETAADRPSAGFYVRAARFLGTDLDGSLLYEIEAEFAEQQPNKEVELRDVRLTYTTDADVPWTITADEATLSRLRGVLQLRGHVIATSDEGFSGQVTEIRSPILEIDPNNYRAETQSRVQLRIGSRSLTGTGMLALLQENRLELKSNVSGKFVP